MAVWEKKRIAGKTQRTGKMEEVYNIQKPSDGSGAIGSLLLKLNDPNVDPETYSKDYARFSNVELTAEGFWIL